MNYILNKADKKVIWINPDSNKLTGEQAYGKFNAQNHRIVHSTIEVCRIGEVFPAEFNEQGEILEFTKKKVYLKANHNSYRELRSWTDEQDSETETTDIPLADEAFQKHVQGQGWQVDLVKKKEFLHNKVNLICSQKIVNGFTSSALGTLHTYDSDRDDQLNLIGSVSQGTDVYYMCKNSANPPVPDYRQHTAEQIKQVLNDGAQRKLFLLQRANTLKLEIASAQTNTQLIAINIDGGWQ